MAMIFLWRGFKPLTCRGQSAAATVKAALTMIFKAALTTKIDPALP
ncbi:hypothetical protein [Bradyrhizobium sp. RDI18]